MSFIVVKLSYPSLLQGQKLLSLGREVELPIRSGQERLLNDGLEVSPPKLNLKTQFVQFHFTRLTGWAALTASHPPLPSPGPWSTFSVGWPWDLISLTDIAAISNALMMATCNVYFLTRYNYRLRRRPHRLARLISAVDF